MRARLALLAAVVVLGIAGCAPSTPAATSVPELTQVAQGTSDLETNEWVVAARASDLGYRLAVNSLDFTIEPYVSTRTPAIAATEFDGWKAQVVDSGAEPVVYPGPSILLPLAVTETDDGAEVEFCNASGRFQLAAGETGVEYDLASGSLTTWTLRSVDGTVVVGDRTTSTTECDATGAPVWTFDPQPTARESVTMADVRPPAGWND